MTDEQIEHILSKAEDRVLMQVAINTKDIHDVKQNIHEIKEDIRSFRRESREDAKATRQAVIAFATAISVPIVLAALRLAFG